MTRMSNGHTAPLESRVAQIDARVTGIETTLNGIVSSLNQLSDKIGLAGRPNYLLLSIIVMLAGGVFTWLKSEIGRVEASQVRLDTSSVELAFERGRMAEAATTAANDRARLWAGLEKWSEKTELHDNELDTRLQREMRDVNAITDTKIDAADRRLQEEISRSATEYRSQREALAETIEKMEARSIESAVQRANHEARLQALERRP